MDWAAWGATWSPIVNLTGLSLLVILFATDRVLTKGQHNRRVADIEKAHAELMAEKDKNYAELKESRDYYRSARIVERDRADRVTDQLADVAELARLSNHLLESLNEAAKDATA